MAKTRRSPELLSGDEYRITQARTPMVDFDSDIAIVTNTRMGEYPAEGDRELRWGTVVVDLNELTNVHVLMHSWGASFRGVGHAMACFEFATGPNLVCSVEARLRKGQRYSVIAGMRRSYPLHYSWCLERDALLERESDGGRAQVASVETDITQHRARQLFRAAAARTNKLIAEPEWYHSAANSCSSNMVGWAEGVAPSTMLIHPQTMIAGYLHDYLVRKGMVRADATSVTGDPAMAADVLPLARALEHEPDFDALLHRRKAADLATAPKVVELPKVRVEALDVDLALSAAVAEVAASGGTALFTGSSGTGKTLAAVAVGAELGEPVLRCDVPSVISRYVGETEKNLAVVFSQAEAYGAPVLFFDGFDEVVGVDSDQLGVLLQRVDTYAGVVLVSTRTTRVIDEAHLRRFDHVVTFS